MHVQNWGGCLKNVRSRRAFTDGIPYYQRFGCRSTTVGRGRPCAIPVQLQHGPHSAGACVPKEPNLHQLSSGCQLTTLRSAGVSWCLGMLLESLQCTGLGAVYLISEKAQSVFGQVDG